MKGKKMSAFAILHGKSTNVQQPLKKELKSPVNDAIQKKKKKHQSPSYDQASSLTINGHRYFKPSLKVKGVVSYTDLENSPSVLKEKRSNSCPEVNVKSKKAKGHVPVRKREKSRKVSSGITKSAKKVKPETCSVVTSPQPVKNEKFLSPCLTENEGKCSLTPDKDPGLLLPNSTVEAAKCFQWLIHPVTSEKFFKELWENKPLLVKRHHSTYYKGMFSCLDLDTILREKHLYFTKHIDVTTYVNSQRETHNPNGRAYPGLVWDFYTNGCSVRLLNPQTFSKSVWKLNSLLQEYFGSCVGANVYLTPPGTQGFAPHYDDIEAFVLQLEGKKRWKLYNPRNQSEMLPRFSSGNFRADEIGEPILNVELEPGDLLYFPRGTIHQACTSDDTHSLHITVSTYQRNSWGDFFEKLVPRALQLAIEEDVELREGLPLDYFTYMGVAHSDKEEPKRKIFYDKVRQLLSKLYEHSTIDACADEMAKGYMHDCLPPLLSKTEKACSIHVGKECWKNGPVQNNWQLNLETSIRLFRANVLRLVTQDDDIVGVCHFMDNSREYHGEDLQMFDIGFEFAPAVEFLIHSYPQFVLVQDLPLEETEEKIMLANTLFEKGLLLAPSLLNQETKV